jgi:hypothetical protein
MVSLRVAGAAQLLCGLLVAVLAAKSLVAGERMRALNIGVLISSLCSACCGAYFCFGNRKSLSAATA